MKWFLALLATALIVAFFMLQRNAVKTSYVNGLPQYSSLPGREYILEHDCYVFKFKKSSSVWPLIGANDPTLSLSVPDLPLEVSEKAIGTESAAVRVLDVVKSGSRFKLVSVRKDESRKGVTISFEILLVDEADRHYPRLDAYWILDHSPEKTGAAPKIIEGYAVERVKK